MAVALQVEVWQQQEEGTVLNKQLVGGRLVVEGKKSRVK